MSGDGGRREGIIPFDAAGDPGELIRRPAFRKAPAGLDHLDAMIDFAGSGAPFGTRRQVLLNQEDRDGRNWSVTGYIDPSLAELRRERDVPDHVPGMPTHHHAEEVLIIVLTGELRERGRSFRAGEGFLIPGDTDHMFEIGEDGAHYIEIRHGRAADRTRVYTESDPAWWTAHGWKPNAENAG